MHLAFFQYKELVMKQVFNPYLPLHEYIPDGEPHVFGDRVYIFGSHDREGGYTFCMDDYVVYSAPVDDLTDWRYEGVSYRACQDPDYPKDHASEAQDHAVDTGNQVDRDLQKGQRADLTAVKKYMYAPDVVQGNDGRYYLYYCMGGDYGEGGYTGPISVAVSDRPEGKYQFLGHVRNKDGSTMMKYVCFDPAAMNDDGVIRIYYGTQYGFEDQPDYPDNPEYIASEMAMFGRSKEEILSYPDSIMGPVMLTLEDDMLTVKEEARHIIPCKVKGTSFEEHPFFEGSSMRKVGDKYYFIYSSWQNHELCYATSKYPDRDFTFGGTIVSNGDIGFEERKNQDKLNMTGTTHGSIVKVKDQWYVFYHRLTHKSDYSRQSCAEKIYIEEDGSIKQVEVTSCGLNKGPLLALNNTFPAPICCNLTNGYMPHGSNTVFDMAFPNVTNLGDDRFIGEIEDGTLIGYKYFNLEGVSTIEISCRFEDDNNRVKPSGPIRLDERCFNDIKRIEEEKDRYGTDRLSWYEEDSSLDKPYFAIKTSIEGNEIGRLVLSEEISSKSKDDSLVWKSFKGNLDCNGLTNTALYLVYHGKKRLQFKELSFL